MYSKTIDACALSCPRLVILAHKAMSQSEEVTTLVTSGNLDNLPRLAEKAAWQGQAVSQQDGYAISYNTGVELTVRGSPIADDLRAGHVVSL